MSSTPLATVSQLSRYLDLVAQRQGLVAENIANIDTPGYLARDIDFAGEVEKAMQGTSMQPATAKPVMGLIERPDGNNVNADREGLLLAQTQLQFRTGVELLRSQLQRISMAIKEGSVG